MASPVAATVSSTGITAPNFATILNYLITQFQAIYGADSYLGNDSQDGQLLGIFAQAISDCNSAVVAAYNSFSPSTAQGNGLSSMVQINGLTRIPGSFSTAALTLTGVAGTTITNGLAQDTNGYTWALPTPVTSPASGTVTVTATCTTIGAIAAGSATITSIQTPVYGWQSVTNAAATPGQSVESDAALRVRQAVSVALPSVTVFDGVIGAIEQVVGVTRVAAYENNTASTDGNGMSANSVGFVVEGGNGLSICQAIAAHMPPGITTYKTGTYVSNTIIDVFGTSRVISFMTPTESTVGVSLTIHGLNGWNTAAEPLIQAALIAYIDALPIGQTVSYTGLIIPAYLANSPYAGTFLIKSMTINKNSGGFGTTDLTLAFNEAVTSNASLITFTIV